MTKPASKEGDHQASTFTLALLSDTPLAALVEGIQHQFSNSHQNVASCVVHMQLKQHVLELQQTRDSLKEQIKSAAAQEEEWDAVHCE